VYGIYGAIISFYFGLRTVEKKKIESLIKKGDAIEILKTRYALGELLETEFESMKKQLKKTRYKYSKHKKIISK